ncbi:hypothetical protein EVAR_9132_1 [Eumeta japonica]|uniref:Uncharacterized protein n=1 Tax=Eumeta variegata TaxID=151549 RepID=A0A4C1TWI5_EUMVA|nr:hypothetical protein EVAR_9132_1 [Eumeta japonica]
MGSNVSGSTGGPSAHPSDIPYFSKAPATHWELRTPSETFSRRCRGDVARQGNALTDVRQRENWVRSQPPHAGRLFSTTALRRQRPNYIRKHDTRRADLRTTYLTLRVHIHESGSRLPLKRCFSHDSFVNAPRLAPSHK